MKKIHIFFAIFLTLSACKSTEVLYDASGTFEAREVIVSAEQTGRLLALQIDEGDTVSLSQIVGSLETMGGILPIKQADIQAEKGEMINPFAIVVLSKYASQGEFVTIGKPLYKVADMSELTLRAYITGGQLSNVRLGQKVKVFVDDGADKVKELVGTISWIANKAEFTPKTIQTKDERANLVYAIKIKVKNNGMLKIGMYGEVMFSEQ